MGETSPSPNRRRLTRATIVGIGLGLAGVVFFVLLWITLGNAGVDQFPRLVISVCAPPAIIALAVGLYFLVTSPTRLS